jgi:hypothetical protein
MIMSTSTARRWMLHVQEVVMKIVILDGRAVNPGDLNWRARQELGEVEVFDRTLESDIVARASDADILLTTRTLISAATIYSAQALTLYRRGVHGLRPNRPEGSARS